ncbi:tRNA (adenosine(37)-N6)-dimethylallyltransferase MiaA [Candidatus Parcubacteria bacterium]|jgi:tRNA dimethylallyltransferase|nr:MAG: tRNA (adenosine(37)-N6)-dimethylallyltransferase MiaA [Candidatus Parcubacteria bacterium]
MMKEPRIFVIVGPTASGKSDCAVLIAKKVNGEIISADSRQVYKGMNLGTGKITKKEMAGIPHHLLDTTNPWNEFSVSRYKRLGRKIIIEIIQRGKTPIVCGGTGHYIEALVDGLIIPEVRPDKQLRKVLQNKTPQELFKQLQKLDPERASTIDMHNPRRLVRAIEIATHLGRVPQKQYDPLPYKTLWIGISKEKEELEKRIHTRLLSRIKKGMIQEIQNLHDGKLGRSVSWKKLDNFGLEYRYVSRHLRGLITKEEMIHQLEKEIIDYSKRQHTWFKRNKRIQWINNEKGIEEILNSNS